MVECAAIAASDPFMTALGWNDNNIVIRQERTDRALIRTSQGIDTSKQNPVGQLQLGVLMAVAEFERALIKERTLAGLEVARRRGKRLGRPPLDPKIAVLIRDTAARLGHHVRAIAREIHAPPSTVCRVLARSARGLGANAPAI